jgi:hypothetical protein
MKAHNWTYDAMPPNGFLSETEGTYVRMFHKEIERIDNLPEPEYKTGLSTKNASAVICKIKAARTNPTAFPSSSFLTISAHPATGGIQLPFSPENTSKP